MNSRPGESQMQPTAGLVPDVEVTSAVEDVAQDVNRPMLKIRELVADSV